jgi:uncharacterized protein YkwD
MGSLLYLVAALVGLAFPRAEAPRVPADCPATPGQEVVDRVNAERAAHGLAPYRVNLNLQRAALAHARDLSHGDESGHRGSDGSDPATRAERAGYVWSWIGENVAAGQASPSDVVEAWMGSQAHRHNVLDRRFQEVGVGFEPEAASRWGTYWVMMFGARQDGTPYVGAECNP